MLTAEKPSWQFCSAFVPNSFLSPRGTGLLISKHSVWHDKGKEAPFQAGVIQEGGGTQTPAANSFPTCSGFSMIILRIVPCKEENKDSVMIVF